MEMLTYLVQSFNEAARKTADRLAPAFSKK
jgi:hypothetical protein